jgi:hypothetical protein
MRAFVALRHFALTYGQIVEKLNDLEGKIDEHEDVLQKVIQALRNEGDQKNRIRMRIFLTSPSCSK